MKILELNRWLAPGGGERFIVDLSNALVEDLSNEVYLCTYFDDTLNKNSFYKSELKKRVHYVNLKGKSGKFGQVLNLFKVLFFIFKLKPDVVHCHLSAFYMCVLPCLLFRKIKFVNTLHNVAEKNIRPGFEKKLKGFMYKHGMLPVTISPLCYKSFSDYMHFNNSIMIDNGCRMISPTLAVEEVKKEIASYKRSPNTRIFVNVARLHPQKNHELLVEAFGKLVDKGYDVVLLIIGAFDDYPEITRRVRSLIQTDRIYLLGTKHNVSDYLYNSDAFCLSSKWEGAPISLLEAGFAGCFPLCTPAGGCIDDIASEEWGYLSTDFSVEEYLKILERFMQNELPSREKIASLYKNKFAMVSCAQRYMEIFR